MNTQKVLLSVLLLTILVAAITFIAAITQKEEYDPLRIEGVYGETTMDYPITYETHPGWTYHADRLWLPTILKPAIAQPVPQWGWSWEMTGPRIYFGGSNENQNRPVLSPRFTLGKP